MMMKHELNTEKLIRYWIEGSDEDFETMMAMFHAKRYSWALFIGHLMIEKLLKAYFVKVNEIYPPQIHNLLRLAEQANLDLTEDQKQLFVTITAFNINARYDDYKMSFRQRCTREFTDEWINNLTKLQTWIKQLITA